MVWWIYVMTILTIQSTAYGFLFTPKFQIFLNQMRASGVHDNFIESWDFNKQNGFSHTTNQFGKYLDDKKTV